jgi:hypothetical protein
LEFKNQGSGWSTINFEDPLKYQFGLRYIPTISLAGKIKNKYLFDTELSANAYGNLLFTGKDHSETNKTIKPYRMWVRFSTNRFELRAGLQKINFGSAAIFRPLMWFDQMDFRDPLQLTDGVYALLGRYYFKDNISFWLWALRGNDKPKGWEVVGSKKKMNEYGGRLQLPLGKGEIGVSYHTRMADYSEYYAQMPEWTKSAFREDMHAIDGKYDIGVGIWFEYVYKNNKEENKFSPGTENYLNAGLDYTFNVGNGLSVTGEYFRYSNAGSAMAKASESNYAVLAANYPVGLLNTISGVVYYNFDTEQWYRFINIQRKYDFWSFYLMMFSNPKTGTSISPGSSDLFSGKGIQFMTVVNF